MRLWLFVVVATGCGRIGFDARNGGGDGDGGGGGDDGPGTISLRVTSEGSGAGAPVGGAQVVVERSGGSVDRVTTDEIGEASFAVPGPTTFHVAYETGGTWRVYTINAARAGGTVVLGGRAPAPVDKNMMFALPANGGGLADYTLRFGHCATPQLPYYGSASFTIGYLPECEGRAVHVYAFTRNGGVERYIDGGMVTLAAGTSHTVNGAYTTSTALSVPISNVPAGTDFVTAELLREDSGELIEMFPTIRTAAPSGGSATVAVPAAPFANTLRVRVSPTVAGINYAAQTIAKTSIANPGTSIPFDASTMLPPLSILDVTTAGRLQWGPATMRGLLYAIDAQAAGVHWTAYLDPGIDHAVFPELPGELGVPAPGAWSSANVLLYDLSDGTAATLVESIDGGGADLSNAWTSNVLYVLF